MVVSKLMSCAFSFGRMGLDFRSLIHYKFSQMVLNIFQNKIEAATKSFTSNEKIDLIDDGIFENTQSELKKEINRVDLSAPLELCIWDELCIFGNSIINALNEIRHSIYINSIHRVFNILHFSFQNIFAWLDFFLSNQENIFIVKKATFLLIKQFLPFINCCFFSCFPYEQCAKKYFITENCSLNEYSEGKDERLEIESEETEEATKLRRIRKKPPEGWDLIEPTLEEFEAKMREAETEPHEGKRRTETVWPVFRIHHQRSRYIFNLFYKEEKISKELYQFCIDAKLVDALLAAKWKKQGFENLCCLRCIQTRDTNFGTNCICRVPKSKLDADRVIECIHCGCRGCSG
uniref:Protein BUD31 homolog n=1 Tax=Meloidogyne incognita TaxID=6306 RepID=A0A914NQQ1_MELIC